MSGIKLETAGPDFATETLWYCWFWRMLTPSGESALVLASWKYQHVWIAEAYEVRVWGDIDNRMGCFAWYFSPLTALISMSRKSSWNSFMIISQKRDIIWSFISRWRRCQDVMRDEFGKWRLTGFDERCRVRGFWIRSADIFTVNIFAWTVSGRTLELWSNIQTLDVIKITINA